MTKRLFKIFSIIFILYFICFYGYRFIHYYRIYERVDEKNAIKTLLSKKITESLYQTNNMKIIDEDYIIFGKNVNNYIAYSGRLWQILEISKDKKIKVISVDNIINSVNVNGYASSNARKYLNDQEMAFYRSFQVPESIITDSEICEDLIVELDQLSCKDVKKYQVGIPSLNDYINAGGSESFINNHQNWWLSNAGEKASFFVDSSGSIKQASSTYHYGLRAIITFGKEIYYEGGNGSLEDPYIVGLPTDNLINQKLVGEYVKISDRVWRIVDKTDVGVKVALDGVLDEKMIYDKRSSDFESSELFNYLNSDYYELIKHDRIVKGRWYVGSYNKESDYDYNRIYDNYIEGYVGLLNANDLYLRDYPNTFTMTELSENGITLYIVTKDGDLANDLIRIKYNVRPAIYLNSNTKIVDGLGTKDDPYVLE